MVGGDIRMWRRGFNNMTVRAASRLDNEISLLKRALHHDQL